MAAMGLGIHPNFAAFPYPPYDIQQQLMSKAYETLEKRQIGLLESPTGADDLLEEQGGWCAVAHASGLCAGTGKTLSLICSTLQWLEDDNQRQRAAEGSTGLPDWISTTTVTTQQQSQERSQVRKQQKKQAPIPRVVDQGGMDISEFLVHDTTATPIMGTKCIADAGYISCSSDEEPDTTVDHTLGAWPQQPVPPKSPQLIFCSRTHSQLSQFVGELHRTRFADSITLAAVGSRKTLCVNEQVLKLQTLSQMNERCLDLQRSRTSAGTCSRKAAIGASNESKQLVEFMQAGKKRRIGQKVVSNGCPYLRVEGGAAGWDEFTDLLLAAPVDVEELANLGRKKRVCPYYASRRALPQVDVILAPYSTILMPNARESMGIQLKDSVVVFDEAHNLLDAINGAHSTAVSAWQLLSVQRSLTAYYERFRSLLNPANTQFVQLLLRIAPALHKCILQPTVSSISSNAVGPHTGTGSRVMAVNDLLFDLGIDNINMFELARWVKDNKLAYKVSAFTSAVVAQAGGAVGLQQQEHQQQAHAVMQQTAVQAVAGHGAASQANDSSRQTEQQQQQQQHRQQQEEHNLGQLSAHDGVSAIHCFISFLLSLTNCDDDGRVIIEPAASAAEAPGEDKAVASTGRGGHMRYILLNAARHFGRVLSSARSVLLVSGTLAPVEGLKAQLFPGMPDERLVHFECGHVVPPEQLLAVAIGRGPSGRPLTLRHDSRHDPTVMDELGQLLLNIAAVVPEGLVVFLPSFTYLDQLVNRWTSSDIMRRLQQRKRVFREPPSATEVEQVLSAYAGVVSTASSNTSSMPSADQQAADVAGKAGAAAAAGAANVLVASAGPVRRPGGAVMLCVVGGKLSEGINFGDGLGRCVVMFGMPYPNPSDLELRERMAYLDKQAATNTMSQSQQVSEPSDKQPPQQQPQHWQASAGPEPVGHADCHHSQTSTQAGTWPSNSTQPAASASTAGRSGSSKPITGRDYYEDLCFKAVNQCVGRVVRHRGDYAAIVLVDSRWVVETSDWAALSASLSPIDLRSQDLAGGQVPDVQPQQPQQQAARHHCAAGIQSSKPVRGRQLPVQKLPGWVQRSFVPTTGDFGQAYKQLAQFFRPRQQQQVLR